ncbi:hypothetical protein WJX73_003851 [Symbiochloris irregularis]|uniref:Uncharacterized protein n=1 Tax=Symbiochloris irregularis TaxID=706552 RepID=A0AAW1NSM8_9CHLO
MEQSSNLLASPSVLFKERVKPHSQTSSAAQLLSPNHSQKAKLPPSYHPKAPSEFPSEVPSEAPPRRFPKSPLGTPATSPLGSNKVVRQFKAQSQRDMQCVQPASQRFSNARQILLTAASLFTNVPDGKHPSAVVAMCEAFECPRSKNQGIICNLLATHFDVDPDQAINLPGDVKHHGKTPRSFLKRKRARTTTEAHAAVPPSANAPAPNAAHGASAPFTQPQTGNSSEAAVVHLAQALVSHSQAAERRAEERHEAYMQTHKLDMEAQRVDVTQRKLEQNQMVNAIQAIPAQILQGLKGWQHPLIQPPSQDGALLTSQGHAIPGLQDHTQAGTTPLSASHQ